MYSSCNHNPGFSSTHQKCIYTFTLRRICIHYHRDISQWLSVSCLLGRHAPVFLLSDFLISSSDLWGICMSCVYVPVHYNSSNWQYSYSSLYYLNQFIFLFFICYSPVSTRSLSHIQVQRIRHVLWRVKWNVSCIMVMKSTTKYLDFQTCFLTVIGTNVLVHV